jgi:hypothetical protein
MRAARKSDTSESCAFIREHFLGPQSDIAFTLATTMADCFVGKRIATLSPETDLLELLGISEVDYQRTILAILPLARLDALGKLELVKALEEEHARDFMLRLDAIVTFRDLVRFVQDLGQITGEFR